MSRAVRVRKGGEAEFKRNEEGRVSERRKVLSAFNQDKLTKIQVLCMFFFYSLTSNTIYAC